MRGFGLWLVGGVLAASAAVGEAMKPAELPPADYAGQQYVDSQGCLFVRAGAGGKVLWIPRVSRDGVAACDNPPSGRRVPVVEEVGVQPVPKASVNSANGSVAPQAAVSASDSGAATGGYFVAVGSFGVAENADRAEAKLGQMNYPVIRSRVQGGSGTLITVFVGPFTDASQAEVARVALRDSGFPEAALIRP
jgi:cell division septation protein DedD